ncbi:MAG: copper-translocating P-type ATPase, partial [Verrucomicrobiota bacterium]
VLLGLPVLLLGVPHMVPQFRFDGVVPHRVLDLIQLALSTFIVLWSGWPVLARGLRSLVRLRFDMLALVTLGLLTAYAYSVAATLLPASAFPKAFRHGPEVPLYFEVVVVIAVLVLIGQVMELKARTQTGSAIRALLRLAPTTARLVRDGREMDVRLLDLLPGHVLRVRPGDRVPVDGIITQGHSFVDESMITGESVPVQKGPGSVVTGGTVNGNGTFLLRAEKVGADTLLAKIVEMVAQAQITRVPMHRLADRVSSFFVPIVLLAAVGTFIGWAAFGPEEDRMAYALINAASVLIIACPCALGLATPLSITMGVARGAHMGILIKSAEALEVMGKVNTVVVDKTGTLTEGKPRLTTCIVHGSQGLTKSPLDHYLLMMAASLEQNSNHPVAAALVQAAKDSTLPLLPVSDFKAIPGEGVGGRTRGHEVLVGNRMFMETHRVLQMDQLVEEANALQHNGQTVIYVAVDRQARGILAISDPVKETTPEAIQSLHKQGLELVILTGDHLDTAVAVSESLGIDLVIAEILPEQKRDVVGRLKEKGKTVAMAGDGINDAPALAAADVGIAMGTGTDVAMQSAGITLVKGDLRGIVQAIALSRAVMRNIKQNLFFSFFYNLLGIPVAAGALYPAFGILLSPIIAAAVMTVSSLSVISNTALLKKLQL